MLFPKSNLSEPNVVSCCHIIRAQIQRLFQKQAKFDFFIAHYVRIWSNPFFITLHHIINHFLFILFFQINRVKRNAYMFRDPSGVFRILFLTAVNVISLDKRPKNFVFPRFFQQQSRNGAVYSSRHHHKYFRFFIGLIHNVKNYATF